MLRSPSPSRADILAALVLGQLLAQTASPQQINDLINQLGSHDEENFARTRWRTRTPELERVCRRAVVPTLTSILERNDTAPIIREFINASLFGAHAECRVTGSYSQGARLRSRKSLSNRMNQNQLKIRITLLNVLSLFRSKVRPLPAVAPSPVPSTTPATNEGLF
jgi:hypothetical protein